MAQKGPDIPRTVKELKVWLRESDLGRSLVRSLTSGAETLDSAPSHDLDAEQQVLGSIILEPSICKEVQAMLSPMDFHGLANQEFAAVLFSMANKGIPIDLVSVVGIMKQAGTYEDIGGAEYLYKLMHGVAVHAHYTYHAKVVADHALRRKLMRLGLDIVRTSMGHHPAAKIAARAVKALEAFTMKGGE